MPIDWGTIAQVGLNMASQYAGGRNQARQSAVQGQQVQNSQQLAQNQDQNSMALRLAEIELLRKQFEETNRSQRAQQVAQGGAQANVQDISFSRPSHITNFGVSGGMRPSAMGAQGRAAGNELSNQAMVALLKGGDFSPINTTGPIDLDASMPEESTFDKIMGGIGTAGNAVNAYQQAQQLQRDKVAQQAQAAQQQRTFTDILRALQQSNQQVQP
jgi:hypothetical protein